MKKLKIAQLAPIWFPIPPEKYGGTERIISYLAEEMHNRGHEVTLFASGNSKTKAKLFSVMKEGLIRKGTEWSDTWGNNFNYSVAFEHANDYDVMHCHWNILGANYQRFIKTPVIHTFHNIPENNNWRWEIFNYYKNDLNAVFISESERKNCPIKLKNSWIVYNGIDISHLKFNPNGLNHLTWSGRFSRVKGPDLAIKISNKCHVPLHLAGQVQSQASAQKFYNTQIKPFLNKDIQYVGEISQRQFSNFYGPSKIFIFPLQWEEPFGLVIVEANACGTPAIAFARGSMPELIKDGYNGFLVKPGDINGMIKAVKRIYDMPKDEYRKMRQNCRKHVEENFTIEKMVDGYEKVYQDVIKN